MNDNSNVNNGVSSPNDYMAFISYRHADNTEEDQQWATWLHQQLEVYDIPHELIGTTNLRGETIPERIYPVFRDEVSLPANADLSESITDALNRSQFLVVLCSPRAVQSKYVNEEILHFKQSGKADRIMAALLLGEPNASIDDAKIEDPEHARSLECFPEALQYKLNTAGELDKSSQTEPIAANFRLPDGSKGLTNPAVYKQTLLEQGRNKKDAERLASAYEEQINTARLKIIAGILGVELERLIERDKIHQLKKVQAQARQARRFTAIVSSLLFLAIGAGGFALVQYQKSQAQFEKYESLFEVLIANIGFINSNKFIDLVDRYLPISEQKKIITNNDELIDSLFSYKADSYEKMLQTIPIEDVSKRQLSDLGKLYILALHYSRKADAIFKIEDSDVSQAVTFYEKSNRLISEIYNRNKKDNILRELARSYEKLGTINQRLGNYQESLQYYVSGISLLENNLEKVKSDEGLYGVLGHLYSSSSDLIYRHSSRKASEAMYLKAHNVWAFLVENYPNSIGWKSNLARSFGRLASISSVIHNDYKGVISNMENAITIRKKLYDGDRKNKNNQRGLAISYSVYGELLDDFEVMETTYIEKYKLALGLFKKLYEEDVDSVYELYNLGRIYENLGNAYVNYDNVLALDYFILGFKVSEKIYKNKSGIKRYAELHKNMMRNVKRVKYLLSRQQR